MNARALGLLLGVVLDRIVPDPRRYHPVAGLGRLAGVIEARLHAPSRLRGVLHVAGLVGAPALAGAAVERLTRDRPAGQVAATTLATWVVLGGASLEREAHAVTTLLERGDLPAARQRLTHLVGRDTTVLDEAGIARAVVESVAENTSDAVVAPLVLGAVAGVPGLLGYRAANTLDAMVGHRDARYLEFGWAAARLDDVLNLPGARLAAALATLLGPDPRGAWLAWRRDAPGHPSPNAGPVEAAYAGALGIRLGGTNRYGPLLEHRQLLGSGRPPRAADVRRATDLSRKVDAAAALAAAGLAVVVTHRLRHVRGRGGPRRR